MNKDLTNVYKVNEQKGIVKYTVKQIICQAVFRKSPPDGSSFES